MVIVSCTERGALREFYIHDAFFGTRVEVIRGLCVRACVRARSV